MLSLARVVSLVALFAAPASTAAATLSKVTAFGSNPGGLEMFEYVPADAPADAPLVVVLHGCAQQASGMLASGFPALAEQYGILLVFAQQTSVNNPVNCFNWAGEHGDPANLVRGQGENLSLKQMVDSMKARHSVDADRVFIAGFSAGGGTAAVMLATWPEVFAGGAIMSGVPYRCATTVQGAFDCMAMATHPNTKKSPAQWGDLVRAAAPAPAARPRVILFHGASDPTVTPDNLGELVEQWGNVLALPATPTTSSTVAGQAVEQWKAGGVVMMEAWTIAGMGHAVAIGDDPEQACGSVAAYMTDKDLCAAYRAIKFFGLTGDDGPGGGEPDAGPGGGEPDAGPSNPDGPTVEITAPDPDAEVSGGVTIVAEASDPDGVNRIEFRIDGLLRGADALPPYEQAWQTGNYSPGPHSVTATAYDLFNNANEVTIEVTVAAGEGQGAGGGFGPVDPISWGCAAATGSGLSWLVLVGAGALVAWRRRRGIGAMLLVLLVLGGAAEAAPVKVDDFGSNPGALDMYVTVPASAGEGAPVVVVLHGCAQQVAGLDGLGIDALAEARGFIALYPSQRSGNNPALCFNWGGEYGDPANLMRGQGENESIRQMVDKLAAERSIDRARVFVMGFSAGAAMTAVLLATWPDVFSAGVAVAGVPYRCATDLLGSLDCMKLDLNPQRKRSASEWGDLVRAAAPDFDGPRPRLMVVHGASDSTLSPDAATELVEQWTDVHGIDAEPDRSETVAGHQHDLYQVGDRVVVERWSVAGMGHAIPIDVDHGCGTVGAYIEDRDLCTPREALRFFGLDGGGDGGDSDGDDSDGDDSDGDGDGDDYPLIDEGEGGCAAGGAPGGLALLASLGVFLIRRRRQSSLDRA